MIIDEIDKSSLKCYGNVNTNLLHGFFVPVLVNVVSIQI